jgi:uncharacterized membrane protein YciS (DUF1049 family)
MPSALRLSLTLLSTTFFVTFILSLMEKGEFYYSIKASRYNFAMRRVERVICPLKQIFVAAS